MGSRLQYLEPLEPFSKPLREDDGNRKRLHGDDLTSKKPSKRDTLLYSRGSAGECDFRNTLNSRVKFKQVDGHRKTPPKGTMTIYRRTPSERVKELGWEYSRRGGDDKIQV